MAEPLSLPEPPREKLPRSPLRLVSCQVHHERIMAVADVSRALEVHKAVEDIFPSMEEHVEEEISMAVSSDDSDANGAEPQPGWRFRSPDEKWSAIISQSSFRVETANYDRWPKFKDSLDRLARAFGRTFSPKLEKRLGLRMIDHIEYPYPSSPAGFRGLIIDEILGPIVSQDFSASVKTTQGLVKLEGPDGVTINLQHGCQLFSKNYSYVLDHDCFRKIGKPFNVNEILDTVDILHDIAKQVFRAVISDDLYNYFKGDR